MLRGTFKETSQPHSQRIVEEERISSNILEMKLRKLLYNWKREGGLLESRICSYPNRRQQSEINRCFRCRVCDKGYGLIQHLNIHLKTKLHGRPMTTKQYLRSSVYL